MYHLVAAGKGVFVVASGVAVAVASGGVHQGVTVGQLLAGGGGVMAALAALKASNEFGRLRQTVMDIKERQDRHEGDGHGHR